MNFGFEFVRCWCLHILPKGYTKTRRFGGYSNHFKRYLAECRQLLAIEEATSAHKSVRTTAILSTEKSGHHPTGRDTPSLREYHLTHVVSPVALIPHSANLSRGPMKRKSSISPANRPTHRSQFVRPLRHTTAMPNASKTKKILSWSVIAGLLAILGIKTFFIGYYRIPQNGMYPGLPAGSSVFASLRAYSGAPNVKRGDIVVFVREENGQRYNYIWRVVALPGEKVEASGESLTINGQAVQRQRVREADGKTIFREQIGDVSYEVAFDPSPRTRPPDASVTVPLDHFFVMGDNRFGARDSRSFGPISFSSIIGKKL